MVIETKDLGYVEIEEDNIIRFPSGIYGFENAFRFVVLRDNNRENPFMWLQCADSPEPCFIVAEPDSFYSDYEPVLTPQMKESIGLADEAALRLLVIATVPKNFRKITFNLKCPVMINSRSNTARQVILEDDRYTMRYPLFHEGEG